MGRVVYIPMECCVCGKEYTQMVIDGHVSHCHMCGECLRDIASQMLETDADAEVLDK